MFPPLQACSAPEYAYIRREEPDDVRRFSACGAAQPAPDAGLARCGFHQCDFDMCFHVSASDHNRSHLTKHSWRVRCPDLRDTHPKHIGSPDHRDAPAETETLLACPTRTTGRCRTPEWAPAKIASLLVASVRSRDTRRAPAASFSFVNDPSIVSRARRGRARARAAHTRPAFGRILRRLGRDRVRLHSLRHAHARRRQRGTPPPRRLREVIAALSASAARGQQRHPKASLVAVQKPRIVSCTIIGSCLLRPTM